MQTIARKNKINLSDYSYRRDIEHRLLLSQLNTFEVQVLKEIVHHSLKISIDHLTDTLGTNKEQLNKALTNLAPTKLFKIQQGWLLVDKETRKYYESQIEKFDEDFEPNIEFLQNLLNKISIHILPEWYAVPRSSDNIIASIIEKYLLTPEIYRQYLKEIQFDTPILRSIIKDLYEAPHFKIAASKLIAKYQLTREQFEEYILLLEYHFVCCIRYEVVDDRWQEFITPFQEWLDFLTFEVQTTPPFIGEEQLIEKIFATDEFGFILDAQTILQACKNKPIKDKEIKTILPRKKTYIEHLMAKLLQLEFLVDNKASSFNLTSKGSLWLGKSLQEKSAALAVHPLNALRSISSSALYTPRNIRLIESNLAQRLTPYKWVYFEDFMQGFTAPIGNKSPISLKNKGKTWKYALPTYTEEEKQFIKAVIIERFGELGLVTLGTHQGKICFALTSFGRATFH